MGCSAVVKGCIGVAKSDMMIILSTVRTFLKVKGHHDAY